MDDVVSAVQSLVEVVQAEFIAACHDMGEGRWHGLGADARARVTRKAREEVKRLTSALDRVQSHIDALPDGDLSPADLAAGVAALEDEERRMRNAAAVLRAAVVNDVTSSSTTL